jgi:RimJ/RimL family protein N-acetyltransferase
MKGRLFSACATLQGMDIASRRLLLTPVSPDFARQVLAGQRADDWHPQYPLEDELVPLAGLAKRTDPEPVFTLYVVRQKVDGLAVGGIGFFGPPDHAGRVEIGYGLVPAARGQGFATEAVERFLELAAAHGAGAAVADTDTANTASQRVLLKAGFAETSRDDAVVHFERALRDASPTGTVS